VSYIFVFHLDFLRIDLDENIVLDKRHIPQNEAAKIMKQNPIKPLALPYVPNLKL